MVLAGLLALVFTAAGASSAFAAGFTVTSAAISGQPETGFDSGLVSAGRLDAQYAAKSAGPSNPKSFPFSWSGVPAGTKALALILDDPDAKPILAARGIKAPSFLHWIAADFDPSLGGLPADASEGAASLAQGKNGTGQPGYRGPQPPADFPANTSKRLIHIYRLALFALSSPTGLKSGFTLDELKSAMKGKILGEADLNISYSND